MWFYTIHMASGAAYLLIAGDQLSIHVVSFDVTSSAELDFIMR